MESLSATQEVIGFLKELYAPTASAVGVGVQWAWDILVTQMYVHGIGYGIAAISSYTMAFGLGKFAHYLWKSSGVRTKDEQEYLEKYQEDRYTYRSRRSGQITGIVFLALGACVFSSLGSANAFSSIARFVNPRYYAIKETVNFVKNTPMPDEMRKALTQQP